VDVDRRTCGVGTGDPLREQRADRAGEHIAAAGGRECGTARRVDRAVLVTDGAVTDDRPRTLEHDDRARLRGERACGGEAVRFDLGCGDAEQARGLAGMWRDDDGPAAPAARRCSEPSG
jgi:hypothetical protein